MPTERGQARLPLGLEYGLISLVVITMVVTLALDSTPASEWLVIPRALVTLFTVVFLPGYLIQALLFCDQDDLDAPQRLGLSFVLSVSIPPLIVFTLDSIKVPYRTDTLLLSMLAIISILALTSLLRRMLTPPDVRFAWTLPTLRIGGVQRSLDTVLWGGIGVGLVGLAAVFVALVVVPQPITYYTEFYILSEAGTATQYQNLVRAGESLTFQTVIVNKEAQPMDYDLTIENGGQILHAQDGIHLEVGERLQQTVSVTPVDYVEQSLMVFYLYRSGETVPYRTLRFWIRVVPA